MLVVIGEHWIKRMGELGNNIDDYVRYEILQGFETNKIFILVVIDAHQVNFRVPDLPDELQPFMDNQAMFLRDSAFSKDIAKIKKRIKHAPDEFQERKIWSLMNGLRGVLNLAWQNFDEPLPDERAVEHFAKRLAPELFINPNSELSTLEEVEQIAFQTTPIVTDVPLMLNPSNYQSISLHSNRKLQIGVTPSNSEKTIVLYQQHNAKSEARVLFIEFSYTPNPQEYRPLMSIMNEPRYAVTYRLPYSSVFFCRIVRTKIFYHQYAPFEADGTIDSNIFSRLFEVNWLGSNLLTHDQLVNLHRETSNIFAKKTIIHSIETSYGEE